MSSANDSTCWIYLLDWIDIRDNKRLFEFLIDIDLKKTNMIITDKLINI